MNIGGRLIGVLALDHGGQAHIFTQAEKQLAQAVAEMAALVLEREKLFYERAEVQASEISLRETNRLMDDFIGIAGHELRTPLTTVKAGVQLVQRNLQRLVQANQASYTREELTQRLQSTRMLLERVENQANIQNRLIHDLLDFSRIQKNRLELHLGPLNMVQLVQTSVENQRLLEPERVIDLDLGGVSSAMVNGDADRLGQVITNMLSNALKYSEADKPVEVSLTVRYRDTCIQVRDYGPGIPKEMQARIWDRFYRVPGIETKSGSGIGLGLGLHISRTLVELHGGKVGLESMVGEGTTFWFTLPLIA
jgi:signal transduction histidine kinase